MITYKEFLTIVNLKDEDVLNCYVYGSHLYGTNHKGSDIDFLCVTNNLTVRDIETSWVSVKFMTAEEFDIALNKNSIDVLECIFSPSTFKLKEEYKPMFFINKENLRTSISTISSNSWVKAKKKITVEKDIISGKKSLFHAIRILMFGIQLATKNKIYNFAAANWIYEDLYIIGEDWASIETKFLKEFRSKQQDFKMVCPKKYDGEHSLKLIFKNKEQKTNLFNFLTEQFCDISFDIDNGTIEFN